ncbi:MAG: hypothetical protein WD795_16530 [Woeseia sp.]
MTEVTEIIWLEWTPMQVLLDKKQILVRYRDSFQPNYFGHFGHRAGYPHFLTTSPTAWNRQRPQLPPASDDD